MQWRQSPQEGSLLARKVACWCFRVSRRVGRSGFLGGSEAAERHASGKLE